MIGPCQDRLVNATVLSSHEHESGGGAQSSARNLRQRREDSPPPPEVHGSNAFQKEKEALHEPGRDAFHRVRAFDVRDSGRRGTRPYP